MSDRDASPGGPLVVRQDLPRGQVAPDGAHFDVVIVGSGFGGSVSALRLAEKGYSVLVIEKGRRLGPDDFPKTNWNLKRWLWRPGIGWRGLFKMTFFRHVTVLSGVGVGGGSLVYANTLPVPTDGFFQAASWAHLGSWKEELGPHYATAQRMLGATRNPKPTLGDEILREIAGDIGREDHYESNDVAVYFGEPGVTQPDPYFEGRGPERTGCIFCGACMTGCRHGAKNTLDRNYLYLAESLGALVQPDTEVTAIRPRPEGGYEIEARLWRGWWRHRKLRFTAERVVLAGGVLGTNELLLKMKADPRGLPDLSDRLGDLVRTNSEALIGVISTRKGIDLSEGIAITSILHTDEHSHVEPVRYGSGSGAFRTLVTPHSPGRHLPGRLWGGFKNFWGRPVRWLKALTVRNFARSSQILLYMRTLDGTLRFVRQRSPWQLFRRALRSRLGTGERPKAFMPEATDLAQRFGDKVDGVTMSLWTEMVLGTPTTAHILGGCCMGEDRDAGVIDSQHRVFGYDGMYVIDGAAISANPGVNPSLTITALAERAMSFIPDKPSS